jgi:hypothetical protein
MRTMLSVTRFNLPAAANVCSAEGKPLGDVEEERAANEHRLGGGPSDR